MIQTVLGQHATGLRHPTNGHLSFDALSPAQLITGGSAVAVVGLGRAGVLGVTQPGMYACTGQGATATPIVDRVLLPVIGAHR